MQTKYVLKTKTVYGIGISGDNERSVTPIYLYGKTKKEITEFIKLCNKEKLETVHLNNVIADMLY